MSKTSLWNSYFESISKDRQKQIRNRNFFFKLLFFKLVLSHFPILNSKWFFKHQRTFQLFPRKVKTIHQLFFSIQQSSTLTDCPTRVDIRKQWAIYAIITLMLLPLVAPPIRTRFHFLLVNFLWLMDDVLLRTFMANCSASLLSELASGFGGTGRSGQAKGLHSTNSKIQMVMNKKWASCQPNFQMAMNISRKVRGIINYDEKWERGLAWKNVCQSSQGFCCELRPSLLVVNEQQYFLR